MNRILLLHGPNLNLLGVREPDRYGTTTLGELETRVGEWGHRMGLVVEPFQSNHEGALIDRLHAARTEVDGIVINAGALTHTSYALHDAIVAVDLPAVEVHISNIKEREPWRRRSVTAPACLYTIYGRGLTGYRDALRILLTRAASPVLTLPYGKHEDQVIDVRSQTDAKARPLAVFFHGGFWRTEYTRDTIDGLAADLAQRGWTTINVEYRRGTGDGWDGLASDVHAALDRIGALPGLAATTTAYVGHSVGAHLAFWAGGHRTPAPGVMVGLAPVLDLDSAGGLDDGAVARLTEGRASGDADPLEAAIVAPNAMTRQILVHGTNDTIVPVDMSRAYAAAAPSSNVELIELDAGHFELLDPARPWWNDIVGLLEG
jgi:3-dehydroquinate dehydratase-2